jgi:hypothetical protein
MTNACVFSADRRHRYSLIHRWDDLITPESGRSIAWICLNPSTADENQLDPTLRRIRGFSAAWGYTHFVMLNAFAFRATDPADMKVADDPVGPDNDRWIRHWAERAERVILGWGEHGAHLDRHKQIIALLDPAKTCCLARNASGQPKHPLYVGAAALPLRFG